MSSETRPTARLREHERADLVPLMAKREYEDFRSDVRARGLLDPLDITAAGVVLDGRHRLRAARQLEIAFVPVRVVAPEDEVEHMVLAALRRRQLTQSQSAALIVELDAYRHERDQARRRQRSNLKQHAEVATLPPRGERTRELAARLAGTSARTIQDAATVHAHDQELFEQVKAGRIAVHTAARRVRRERRDLQLPTTPPLPQGRFELIYADPPWQLGNPESAYAPENHYPTLPLDQIKQLPVPAADNAVLFLWVVNALLPDGITVMQAWGFEYKTCLVWIKNSIGLGVWLRNRHELLLVGRRGNHPPPDPEDRPDSVIEAARRSHSEKPALVYQLLERAYPHTRKLEVFARGTPRPGWSAWGNQVDAA